ncbi:transposon Tf2-6 polyprotein [Trichonephila clavipes]|nr:transposon Tf2-6 polyprotein [Trichonephila clavipes]
MEQQIADMLRQNQDLIRALQIRDDSHSHKVTIQFEKFDEEKENYDSFIERFETYLDVQNVPIANRAKVFVSSLSAKLYQLLKKIFAPDIPSDQTSNNVNSKHNILLCETKISFPMEKIVSTLVSEKVLQTYSEELTIELIPHSVALASKRVWNTLDKTLRSFWETENLSEEQPIISDELSYCEKHIEKTHFRKPCGRYSVSLPFKENIQENVNLGDSRSIASKRLDQLWRRLDRDPKLNNLYTKFIEEHLRV